MWAAKWCRGTSLDNNIIRQVLLVINRTLSLSYIILSERVLLITSNTARVFVAVTCRCKQMCSLLRCV